MQAEQLATSMVALVVALLNLLVAAYALVSGARERARAVFAAGPAGVGLWALAWLVFELDPSSVALARTAAAASGLLAMAGFAADALLALDPARRRLLLAVAGAGAVVAAAVLVATLGPTRELASFGAVARFASLLLAGVVVAGHALLLRAAPEAERSVSRWMLLTSAVTALLTLALVLAAWIGDRTAVDPLLLVVLLAELWALVYILEHKVEVRVMVSRAVTYALLTVVVALVAAGAFSLVGYALDPVLVIVSACVSLLASALFMGLSERLAAGVERVLFPEQARLERALRASKGELSALRRRLERAEKLAIAGELAASVAHEIKNPLAPIRGYAQLLQGRLAAVDDEQRPMFEKALGIIREETDRIDHRVAELLRAARAERTTASMDESVELERVLLEAVAVAEGEAGRVRVVRRLEPGLGRVVGNEDELRGALLNLLKNALEAMAGGEGAKVEIAARREGGRAVVEIVDDGPGLAQKDAERVFETFYTTKAGGTGLGLAIARSAVDAAGGELTLENRTDARGAVARVVLDLAPAAPRAPTHPEEETP